MKRRALRRRYGRMHQDQRYHVTVKSPAGTVLERWGATQSDSFASSESDIALRIAAMRPAGTIIEIHTRDATGSKPRNLVWRYEVGRMAGLPSVTRIKKGSG